MSKTTVQLGRGGDILNVLPLLYQDFLKTNQKQRLMVAKDYASLLEGCSYIEPIIYNGNFTEINKAMSQAMSMTKDVVSGQVVGSSSVITSQVYGRDYDISKTCDSFLKESWRLLGRLDEWRFQYPLVFDKRDKRRERKHYSGLPKDKKWIIVSTEGTSSPFQYADLLMELVKGHFPDLHIVDLSQIKADRFYDLLGLFDHENTHCIIATDSAPIHLAYAVNKPVVALIVDTPTPWHGSAYRKNHIRHIRYSKFPEFAISMLDRIDRIGMNGGSFNSIGKGRKIVHFYPDNGTLNRREKLARQSWYREYGKENWISVGIPDGAFISFVDGCPMVKDFFRIASMHADDEDILLYSNSDICFTEGFSNKVLEAVDKYGSVGFLRRDFFTPINELLSNEVVATGDDYAGKDCFAVTKLWWRNNYQKYPDMVIGRECWDLIFGDLILMSGGAIMRNLIYHEKHDSKWLQDKENNEGNKHNRKLAVEFLKKHNRPLRELDYFVVEENKWRQYG